MITVRIALIALALSAGTALAQEQVQTTLTVVVTDTSGARIPGALIVASNQTTGLRFERATDGTGQAIVYLDKGTYELRVQAPGFKVWEEKVVEVKAEMHRNVTLAINNDGLVQCGPCVGREELIPLVNQAVADEIPLIPPQQFTPPAKPLRHRLRWF